jgi:lipopolysaccharide assembly protein A
MTTAREVSSESGRGPLAVMQGRWIPAALALVTALFILQNRGSVSIDVFWITLSAPLWLVLALVFCAGALCAALVRRRRARGSRSR